MPDDRSIELDIEVAGTPEEVWEAIATGPGITAWFVPTTVEERAGGAVTQHFGPDMDVTGHVQAWEPPHRFAYGEHAEPTEGGMAFEWLVEARDGGSCVVRLVNSGFGHGQEWDDELDSMENGWRIFLRVLALHLERFAGQVAHRVQALAMVPASDDLWARGRAGLPLDVTAVEEGERHLVFTVDEPAPGTGFLAVEGAGTSVWLSLYGPDGEAAAAELGPRLQSWVEALGTSGA